MRNGLDLNISLRGERLKTNLMSSENKSARWLDDDDDTGGTNCSSEGS